LCWRRYGDFSFARRFMD